MEYRCPYCGNQIKAGLYCNNCLKRIDRFQKIWNKSGFYYNKGLEAAKNGTLSLAATYLQKAIILYKYNIEARNVLGLVYFEMGQVGAALKEWIVSQSFKKDGNEASLYIEELQKQPKLLHDSKEAAALYNKALSYLRQDNIDMAAIRLKKAVSILPKFLEARVLLALCYIEQKQFYKANEQIKKALAIDPGHKLALYYFKILSQEDTDNAKPYELEYQSKSYLSSHLDKGIDRAGYLRRYGLYFILGAAAMAIICWFLIIPSQIKSYQDETLKLKETEAVLTENINTLNQDYENKLSELQSNKEKLEKEVADYESQVTILTQKEKLASSQSLIEQGEYVEASKVLYSIASSSLDETDAASLQEMKDKAYPRAVEALYNEALGLYNQGENADASAEFESILLYDPDDWTARKSLYYLGDICETNGDLGAAKQYYEKIVAEYPDTREASRSSSRLEAMAEE